MKLILASNFTKSIEKVAPDLKKSSVTSALCIPTAANVYAPEKRTWLTDEMEAIRATGIELDIFDLEGKTPTEIEIKLAHHKTVYVTGGNTYFLLEQMRNAGFDKAIKAWLAQGNLYMGASAGAVIACPDIDFIRPMDEPEKSNLKEFSGLNLYPKCLVPHTDHPKYGQVALGILQSGQIKEQNMMALNDDQILLCDGVHETIL